MKWNVKSRMNKNTYGNLVCDKEGISKQWGKIKSFKNQGDNWLPLNINIKLYLFFIPHNRINSKWFRYLNAKLKAT